MSAPAAVQPAILVVLDGWGLRAERTDNAIALARTPAMDRLGEPSPGAVLGASGEAVGLPAGQMGNSEVGHMNMGAGRVVFQEFVRISKAIADGRFFENPVLRAAADRAAARGTLHLLGLVSDGGVHSHLSHLEALLRLARDRGAARVAVHAVLDGRDVPPRSALGYLDTLERAVRALGTGVVATVAGRWYTMDRDQRWDRVQAAWDAMVHGRGARAASAREAVEAAYAREESDEFVAPTVVVDSRGEPRATIRDGDEVIVFNFRPDRVREITRALADPAFDEFPRGAAPHLGVATFTMYDASFTVPVAFAPQPLDHTVGEIVAERGLAQLRIAETEKYAHVTYFFSGGVEAPWPGEDRCLIPSQKVATYDLKPEMSAPQIADEVVRRLRTRAYPLVVVNFANADMVGHTGVLPAAIAAVETVDRCVGQIARAAEEARYALLVTADHGNAELMADPATGQPHTAHTTNPVPLLLRPANGPAELKANGILADVGPTLLSVMGLPPHAHMTGTSLLCTSSSIKTS